MPEGFVQTDGFDIPDPSELSPEELQERIARGDFLEDEIPEIEEKVNAGDKSSDDDSDEPDESAEETDKTAGSEDQSSSEDESGEEKKEAEDSEKEEGDDAGESGELDVKDKDSKDEEELPQTVPLARLSKEVKRRKELEERLAQLEAAMKKPDKKEGDESLDEYFEEEGDGSEENFTETPSTVEIPPELAELNKKYLEQLDMGETEEAAKTFSEIQAMQLQIAEARAIEKIQAKEMQKQVMEAQPVYDSILEAKKDFFDEDPIAFEAFNTAIDKYAANGLTPKEAVVRAAQVMGFISPETSSDKNVDNEAVSELKDKQVKEKADKLEKLGKQPASLKKVGAGVSDGAGGTNKVNFLNMSDEEIKAMSKEELARLRGDIVEA